VPEPSLRGEHSNPEEPTISSLGEESLVTFTPPIIDLSASLLIQVFPPSITHQEHQIVLQAAMEENATTSSGSPHNTSTIGTIGGIPPSN
jgi:hypothetical protein